MSQLRKSLRRVGKPPGSIDYTGDRTTKTTKIEIITYQGEKAEHVYLESLDKLQWESEEAKWINIYGVNNSGLIREIGNKGGINSLVLEDIVHMGQRPKVEIYDDYIFLVLKMLSFDKENMKIQQEQISFILLPNMLITFQEFEGDVFDSIRKRIKENKGAIRKKDVDYLLYSIIDAIVDEHFILLNNIEEEIEEIEEKIINSKDQDILQDIYKLRKELVVLKTSVWPIKDIINELIKEEKYINEDTKNYLKDVNDHVMQIMDFIIIYREMISGILDTHLSNASNRMNQIMTTLTIFSAIFIPLTFLAGIYGMNFEYIPELSYRYGYPIFWIICFIVAMGMYKIFKYKKWL